MQAVSVSNRDPLNESESNKRTKTETVSEPLSESKCDNGASAFELTTTQSSNDSYKADSPKRLVEFNVVYMKKSHKISMMSTETIGHLKAHLGKS